MLQVNSLNKTASNQILQDKSNAQKSYVSFATTKPDTFELSTKNTNSNEKYNNITTYLKNTGENAQTSLNGQLQSEGWAGKIADKISVLWRSKNRAHLVQEDIDKYNQQIENLVLSIKENKFNQKFKEIFEVDCDLEKIQTYNKKAEQYKLAATTQSIADITLSKLAKVTSEYKSNNGQLEDRKEITINRYDMRGIEAPYHKNIPKEVTFKKMEDALINTVGSKKILDTALKNSGIDIEKASIDSKYKAYGILAEYLIETSKATAKNCTEGKSLKEIKKEYDNAYQNAYGDKNNIQARVDKYNRSQEIGAAAVKGSVRYAAAATLGLIAPKATIAKILYESAVTFGTKLAVDTSEKLTANIKLEDKDIKKLVKDSAISAAEKFTRKSLLKIIPGIETSSDILNIILDQATDITVNTSLGLIAEKMKYGKWYPNQIIPRMIICAAFNNIKGDDDFTKVLLKTAEGVSKQVVKKSSYGDESIKQFLKATRATLDEYYTKDKNTFGDIKNLADCHPEKYNEIIIGLLGQMVKEKQS